MEREQVERPLEILWVTFMVVSVLFLIMFALFAFKYRSLEDRYKALSEKVYQLEVTDKITTKKQHIEPSEVEISVNGEDEK
jgi:preprotein translocase subunit YajC